jgi:DNA-binding beta-propeller fold protein YncE
VIDTTTNQELIGAGFPIPVGGAPTGIAISPDGARVTTRQSVSVIDTSSNQALRTF